METLWWHCWLDMTFEEFPSLIALSNQIATNRYISKLIHKKNSKEENALEETLLNSEAFIMYETTLIQYIHYNVRYSK